MNRTEINKYKKQVSDARTEYLKTATENPYATAWVAKQLFDDDEIYFNWAKPEERYFKAQASCLANYIFISNNIARYYNDLHPDLIDYYCKNGFETDLYILADNMTGAYKLLTQYINEAAQDPQKSQPVKRLFFQSYYL